MKNIWTIAKREYRTFFDSLVAYILLVAFLGFVGFMTWIFTRSNVFFSQQATLAPFFSIAKLAILFFSPALTMRMIAEEKRTGTLEVLLTRAVSDGQVVAGKYLACMMLIGTALLCTLPYYFTVSWLGPVDHGAVWCGYLGTLLLSSVFVSIGLFASSISNNQIVAFLVALLIGFCFYLLFDLVAEVLPESLANVIRFFSASAHYESMARGVIDSRDVIFFASVSLLGLILAEVQLAKRNIVA
ncbi:MAG: ABC transporter permease subunit [Bacteroidota bacterium]